jgi:hypothetical protein
MDDCDIYLGLVAILTSVASRIVIKADELTIGGHPDAELRDAGELAVLDWDQNGGPIVAQLDDAVPLVIERVGQIRTLGAILAAVELDQPDDFEALTGLAISARFEAERLPGGPADPLLRLGLCARSVALHQLGHPGGIERGGSRGRPGAVLGMDPYEFDTLTAIALLRLTGPDKAALERRAAA